MGLAIELMIGREVIELDEKLMDVAVLTIDTDVVGVLDELSLDIAVV